MDEESIYLLNQIQRDIETLYEGTDPKVQRLPNYSVHVHLKKTRMNLKRLNKIISEIRKKYENILKNKTVMDDIDATKVMMAEEFLEDLEEIFQKFISGH
jgi:hypothetical protein